VRPAARESIRAARGHSLVTDWIELTKLRLASFVALAAFVGALLASGPAGDLALALEATFWITCSAAAGGVLNQVLERDSDRLMRRTQDRPLPAGRVSMRDAILAAAVLGTAAVVGLALRFNLLAALLAASALFTYVAVYTPLKRVSTLNTLVGSLSGAAPPLIGYAALSGTVEGWAPALFAIVFAWQFPHFMAIAWLHRADYRRAGMAMLPALDDGEPAAGRQALLYGLVLLPVSLLPALWLLAGPVYVTGALLLGSGYCAAALRFAWTQSEASARLLLGASLAYLPLFLSLVLFDQALRLSASA